MSEGADGGADDKTNTWLEGRHDNSPPCCSAVCHCRFRWNATPLHSPMPKRTLRGQRPSAQGRGGRRHGRRSRSNASAEAWHVVLMGQIYKPW